MAFQSLVTSHSKLLIPAFKLQGCGGAATSAPKEMLIQAAFSCIIKGAPHGLPLNLILFT